MTSLAATMVVNCLVTTLIVFKILRVFLDLKAASTTTSDEGSLVSTRGTKLYRNILFVIIESGMMLLVVQVLRVVLFAIEFNAVTPGPVYVALNYFMAFGEMCNVIKRSCLFLFLLFY